MPQPHAVLDETVPLGEVRPLDRNPRRHPQTQIDEMVRSLLMFGQYRPLVVDETGLILAGNGLHRAMVQAGIETAEVRRYTGLDDATKQKLILADNKTGDLGTYDFEVIDDILRSLDGDLDIPGYDASLLAEILADDEKIMADASGYGVLPPDALDRATNASDGIQRANGSTEQSPIARPETPAGEHACPTCGKPW